MAEQKIYVIADLHFSHKRVVELRPFESVEEHDAVLISNWNSIVSNRDTIWILGDVALGGPDSLNKLSLCNGLKKLVMGNHDCYPTVHYTTRVDRVFGAATRGSTLMTHIPVHPSCLGDRFSINVHGHLHSRNISDDRYRCVSVEQTDYRPVLLRDVIHPGWFWGSRKTRIVSS